MTTPNEASGPEQGEEKNHEPLSQTLTQDLKHEQQRQKLSSKILISSVGLSLVFGSVGGAFWAYYAPRIQALQKFFPQGGNILVNQKITLNEDSAIIDVVKKDSPAVVSIIISQDLNKIPGYGADPFSQDPFFNFFNGSDGNLRSSPSLHLQMSRKSAPAAGFWFPPTVWF